MKLMVAALVLSGSMAMAAVTTEQLVADLQAEGYTWIEVKRGPTQIKIEAVRGTSKTETIIDAETGAILKSETEDANAAEQARIGVKVRERVRNRDFLRIGRDDGADDGEDDDLGQGRDDDDDEDGDRGQGRDDDDDDGNGGRGDDGGDDDHGGDHGGDQGDDHGGDHGGDSDDD